MMDVTTRRARSRAHFLVPGTIDDVHARVRSVTERERRFTWRSSDATKIVIATRMNWATWGEVMTLDLTIAGMTTTVIDVIVAPALPSTIIDWGQGARDIRLLHDRLVAPAPTAAPSAADAQAQADE